MKQIDENAFEIYLGNTTVILSELETKDLCLCIDEVCQQYKNSIIEFENNLETWKFELVSLANFRGIKILSVKNELWNLMYKFACEFDYIKGKSEWHLFHQEDISIRISRGIRDHVFIVPQASNSWTLRHNSEINIIYFINEVHLQSLETGKLNSWKQDIGPRGTWTAKYTQQWLLKKYIPKVIDYYSQKSELLAAELLSLITNYKSQRPDIQEINNLNDLVSYLRDIQSWLHLYVDNIAATLFRSYYTAFTDLVRNTDSAINGMDYIMGNLHSIDWQKTPDNMTSKLIDSKNWNFKIALDGLEKQVARINICQYENSYNADLITRTFIWIIENGKISFSQSQLNAAKQALLPLWEQSRFEMRHVYPNR